ncbi:AraC family transcriptional regulator (plasmid) [Paraburkholderia terrae]|uniref:AraC family transcriptional regulator n=1 Tax=Paraburkholderia terrae TaxID=311230 RepID=A0ABM7UC79_9BURK|nr:helix-turn-helix domain-containing protein [Paraburkholderia terrae]BCZ85630.1 AraC family transcriptional regulator [Paraburkholderia terrae]
MEVNYTRPHARQTVVLQQVSKIKYIDIVLFNGFALPKVAALVEIFQKANALSAPERDLTRYEVSLLSASGGRIASSSSVFVWTESVESHRHANTLHTLFIAGGAGAHHACRDERLNVWLRRAYPRSEIVHPIAEGRLVLEAAGLLSRYKGPLQNEHLAHQPRTLRPHGGGPSALRTSLSIVEEDLGADLARQVAESIAPNQGTPFDSLSWAASISQVSEKIMASARWLDANVNRPISIDDAAQVAAMSERNFLRRFKNEIGMTPSDYLLHARLNLSCRMLVESCLPVDKIARRCGIGSGGHLAKLFRKYFSTTPTEYRLRRQATLDAS